MRATTNVCDLLHVREFIAEAGYEIEYTSLLAKQRDYLRPYRAIALIGLAAAERDEILQVNNGRFPIAKWASAAHTRDADVLFMGLDRPGPNTPEIDRLRIPQVLNSRLHYNNGAARLIIKATCAI